MKKNVVLALLLSASVVACSSKKMNNSNENETQVVMEDEKMEVVKSSKREVITLKDINFEFDSSKISDKKASNYAVDKISSKKTEIESIEINGYCDERGSVEYNNALGERRSKSVNSYLVEKLGSDFFSLNNIEVSIRSMGKSNPKVPNAATSEEHAKNRRVEIVINLK